MAVTIRFFGTLKTILNQDEIRVELASATLLELINLLATRYDRRIKEEMLDEDGRLDFSYAVFIAGERAADLDTVIKDGAALTVTSMLAGGARC